MIPGAVSENYHLAAQRVITDYDALTIKDEAGYRQYVNRDLVRALAEEVFKVARITEDYDINAGGKRIRADVYVFAPNEFWRIVRYEAERMFDRAMNPNRYLQETT